MIVTYVHLYSDFKEYWNLPCKELMYLTSFSTLNVMVNTILILLVFELALLSTWTYLFIGLGGYYNLRNLLSFIQIATCRGEILFLEFVSLAIYVVIVHFLGAAFLFME